MSAQDATLHHSIMPRLGGQTKTELICINAVSGARTTIFFVVLSARLSPAFLKKGLPRAAMSNNSAAATL